METDPGTNQRPAESAAIRSTLLRSSWFAALKPDVHRAVANALRPRKLLAGQRLFSRGDRCDGLYIIAEGIFCVSGVSSEGRQTILDFYEAGFWFGEVSAFADMPRIHDAEAFTDGMVLHLHTDDLAALLQAHPPFVQALLKLEATRLAIVLEALQVYSGLTLDQRLAHRLVLLADRFGRPESDGIVLTLKLTQDTLARLIGSTRQRVNQITQSMEQAGLIRCHYGKLTIRDAEGLTHLAATNR